MEIRRIGEFSGDNCSALPLKVRPLFGNAKVGSGSVVTIGVLDKLPFVSTRQVHIPIALVEPAST